MADADLYDILVVGGGINGCGIARDAAGRGYRVLLAEAGDLGRGTSSSSTKLIHGGLRYLEYYEFRLVREALREREVLWGIAPHIVWPLRFVLPHHAGLRPAWLLRLGLFLYDHLGGRRLLPGTRAVRLEGSPLGAPIKPEFTRGFEYSDCWVEDTRLVVLNARSAAEHGAEVLVHTPVTSIRPEGHGPQTLWRAALREPSGATREVRARLVVNAAGPWVDRVLQGAAGRNQAHNVRLVQGSHIVTKRLFGHDRCYIFQNADGRIIFAIPYETDFTLIGTTDHDYTGDPAEVHATEEEIAYLIGAANEYLRAPITRSDVVWTYSGVRPLFSGGEGKDDTKAQAATRDYVLKLEGGKGNGKDGAPPLLNIFGGKITTYRRLAESALEEIGGALEPRGAPWTGGEPLPGGDFPREGFEPLVARLVAEHAGVSASLVRRLVRAYGTDAEAILGTARQDADLGTAFGAGLHAREIEHLMAREWARTAEDVLWRRSKLGLRVGPEGAAALDAYMREHAREHAVGAAAAE